MAIGKLKFDQPTERLFETGIDECILFPMADTGEYEDGVAWNGIISIEESPSGAEETPLYADNIKYVSLRSKEEWGGTINAYMYPDEFESCDGSKSVLDGFVAGQQARKPFGLVYKTKIGNAVVGEDLGYKIHIVFNCTASVSSKSHQTINESPEAVEMSWEIKSTAITVEDIPGISLKPLSTLTIDSTKVDSDKLADLIKVLYGTDPVTGETPEEGTAPTLPTPAEIYNILKTTNISN